MSKGVGKSRPFFALKDPAGGGDVRPIPFGGCEAPVETSPHHCLSGLNSASGCQGSARARIGNVAPSCEGAPHSSTVFVHSVGKSFSHSLDYHHRRIRPFYGQSIGS